MHRRTFLTGAAALGGAFAMPGPARPLGRELAPAAAPGPATRVALDLVAAERPAALPCFGGRRLPLWTLADGAWPPVVRMQLGQRLDATFENRLARPGEHSSIHWHGIRVPNDQDGVPYLTQQPVWPGGRHAYSFVPPDTGSYFFHPHCNTAEQLGRGMAGILIVEGDETAPYDADEVIVLRDWRIDEDVPPAGDGAPSEFLSFITQAGAGKAGTFGTVRSANGMSEPEIALPACGDCRLRLYNLDNTRVMEVGVEGAEAAMIATDGIALPPVPLKSWRLGPAMRLDIVVRAPADGQRARLVDYFAPQPVPLAHLVGTGAPRRAESFDPAPLRASSIPAPDLANAEPLSFTFSATAAGSAAASAADGGLLMDALCGGAGTFWAINKAVWPAGDHSRIPAPLATLTRGRTYRATLANLTPHQHPIHLHGHSMTWLSSSNHALPRHVSDTVLLQAKERVDVAFVADNPGDWMLHCHIIEHQETGMMGYIRVA